MQLLSHETAITHLALTDQQTYNSLIRTFNEESREPITLERIHRYFDSLKRRGYRSSTLHCAKAAIKKGILLTFPDQANDVRFRASLDTAFRSIRCGRPERRVHREKVLSPAEIQKLVEETPSWLSLIIEVLSVSGLRISELTGIRIKDCSVTKKCVSVLVTGKGYRQRRIFLSLELYNRALRQFGGKEFLFENRNGNRYSRNYIWREVNRHGYHILKKHVSNHTFRHSFCSNSLLLKQKSLRSISAYVGHHSVQLTSSYYIHDELKFEDLFQEAI